MKKCEELIKDHSWIYKGIVFDDFTVDEDKHVWSQVCKECADIWNFSENMLDDAGSGICGVEGCSNEADYYIDFIAKYK